MTNDTKTQSADAIKTAVAEARAYTTAMRATGQVIGADIIEKALQLQDQRIFGTPVETVKPPVPKEPPHGSVVKFEGYDQRVFVRQGLFWTSPQLGAWNSDWAGLCKLIRSETMNPAGDLFFAILFTPPAY